MSWNYPRKWRSPLLQQTELHPSASPQVQYSFRRNMQGDSAQVRMWRRRARMTEGARIRVASFEREDDFALSVLDPSVACAYARNGEKEMPTPPIVERRVAQFYPARDVATNQAGCNLRKVATEGRSTGRSTRDGWRLRAHREALLL